MIIKTMRWVKDEMGFEGLRAHWSATGPWRGEGFYALMQYYDARLGSDERTLTLCRDEEIKLFLQTAFHVLAEVASYRRDIFDSLVTISSERSEASEEDVDMEGEA